MMDLYSNITHIALKLLDQIQNALLKITFIQKESLKINFKKFS